MACAMIINEIGKRPEGILANAQSGSLISLNLDPGATMNAWYDGKHVAEVKGCSVWNPPSMDPNKRYDIQIWEW